MSDRPTPETDAEIKIEMTCACYPNEYVSGDFARKLERERDKAREQNAKLRDIAEMAITAVALWAGSRTNSASELRAELEQIKEGAK